MTRPPRVPPPRPSPRSLVVGLLLTLAAWPLFGLAWPEVALLGSACVLTPLALRALYQPASSAPAAAGSWRPGYWRAAVLLQLPAAALLALSYALDPGPLAAALSAPMAGELLVLARLGAARAWARRFRGPAGELAIDGGLMLQVVGGGWIVVHRAGAHPYGLDDGLVLLSALHTHLAALSLPVLLGLTARRVSDWQTTVATAAVLVGFPVVALGILAVPDLEAPGAWVLAAGALLTAWQQLRAVQRPTASEPPARLFLLGCSSLALLGGAALAGLFALLPYLGVWWLDRGAMLAWHGGLMAAFTSLGFLAWANDWG